MGERRPQLVRNMSESIAAGLHAMTWKPDGSRADAPAEVARAARYYMVAQVENGHMCPVTMTRAAVAALSASPAACNCGAFVRLWQRGLNFGSAVRF